MTRTEAHKRMGAFLDAGNGWKDKENIVHPHVLVMKIFDAFESRTCENCKHFMESSDGDIGACNKGIGEDSFNETVTASFGCNKWEPRA